MGLLAGHNRIRNSSQLLELPNYMTSAKTSHEITAKRKVEVYDRGAISCYSCPVCSVVGLAYVSLNARS